MGERPPRIEPPPSRYAMPDPTTAAQGSDLIAVGADLEPGTLLAAYRSGLFPMPVEPSRRSSQIAWYSPDPRGILPLDRMHVSRTLRRSIRRFEVSVNSDFGAVVRACGDPRRPGYWISQRVISAYAELFRLGWAESCEVWLDGALVGGVYGVRIGAFYAGESMFHQVTDASKVALVHLTDHLRDDGVTLFDVQWTTPHLATLGAIEIPRVDYLDRLRAAVVAR